MTFSEWQQKYYPDEDGKTIHKLSHAWAAGHFDTVQDQHTEYREYGFCKAVNCVSYYPENGFEKENCARPGQARCAFTAKEFHHWLNENGFRIVKAAKCCLIRRDNLDRCL